MKPGSKLKPTHLKLVAGTLRQDRAAPNQPEAYGDLGEPAEYLNALQMEVWRAVRDQAPPGLLTGCDRPAFEGYAVLLAARVTAIRMWNSTGNAVLLRSDQAATRMIVNPYLKEIRRLTEQLRMLDNEFGFTPAARSRISLPSGGNVADPVAKYL